MQRPLRKKKATGDDVATSVFVGVYLARTREASRWKRRGVSCHLVSIFQNSGSKRTHTDGGVAGTRVQGRVARKGGAFSVHSCVESASSSTTTTSVFYFNLWTRAWRSKGRRVLYAVMAQLVENASCKRGHVGSNPIGGSSVPAFVGEKTERLAAWSDDKQRRRVSCLQLTSALRQ